MRSRIVVSVKATPKKLFILTTLIGISLAGGSLPNATVLAADSKVEVAICQENGPGASISITQPNDDSVVNQPVTTFRGQITSTTQIEVEIDGIYVTTIPVGSNQTTFETDIQLEQGTHTVKMIANDICQNNNDEDSLVITYQPVIQPSDGGTTPTDVGGGVVVDPNAVVVDEAVTPTIAQIKQLPIIGAAFSAVADFADFSGLAATVGSTNAFIASSRVGLTVTALTLVVAAGSIAPVVLQAVPGITDSMNIGRLRARSYMGWGLRIVGGLLMGVVYFL